MDSYRLTVLKEECCGCHACEVACKQEHLLGLGPRLIRVEERSPFFIPLYCRHCARPPCREACPVEAIYRDEQGRVLIKGDECIGCRECVTACPFGAMQFDAEGERAVKCDLCRERTARGSAPACFLVCPTRCILWGETRELLDRIAMERSRG